MRQRVRVDVVRLVLVLSLVVGVLVVGGVERVVAQADPAPGGDVSGLELPDGAIVALEPVRLLDTRVGVSEQTIDHRFEGEGAVVGGVVKRVQITGRGGVPVGALSAVMNVTAVSPSGLTFVTVFPCGVRPLASSLNAPAGGVSANELIAKLTASG